MDYMEVANANILESDAASKEKAALVTKKKADAAAGAIVLLACPRSHPTLSHHHGSRFVL